MSLWDVPLDDAERRHHEAGFAPTDDFAEVAAADFAGSDGQPLDDPDDDWDESEGFPDGRGAVRIWLDENRVIDKVRVALRWREKIDKAERLEDAFGRCFLLANNRDLFTGNLEDRFKFHNTPAPVEPIPWDAQRVSELWARRCELMTQYRALAPGDFGFWEGQISMGVAERGNVRLWLDEVGLLAAVEFNDKWLLASSVRVIGNAVVMAHRDAKQKFVEPTYVPGKADELSEEFTQIDQECRAMQAGFTLGDRR